MTFYPRNFLFGIVLTLAFAAALTIASDVQRGVLVGAAATAIAVLVDVVLTFNWASLPRCRGRR